MMQTRQWVGRTRERTRAWWRRRHRAWERSRPFRHPVPWLILAVVVLLTYAWLPAVLGWYWSVRYEVPEVTERTGTHFHALVYDGRAWAADREGRRRFIEHVRRLREAGFVPISLEDVRAFYREGRLLPARAVLVTVDGIPPDRWRSWRSAVIRERFRAVAFVEPLQTRRALWSSLRRAERLPHWDVGVLYDELPVSGRSERAADDRNDGVAFDSALRFERLDRLREAALAQHQRARAEAAHYLNGMPAAAAYPRYAPEAEHRMADEVRRLVLADTAGAFFPLGFYRGGLSINAAEADAMRLNRLSVSPAWDGAQLVRRLRTEAALDFRVGDVHDRTRLTSWIPVLGQPGLSEAGLRLQAPAGEAGDGVWLAGSDVAGDVALDAKWIHESGVLRVLFMASEHELYRWELRLDDTGSAQVRRQEGAYATVVREGRFSPLNEPRRLGLRIRGSQLWVDLDGQPLFDGWVSLRDQVETGMIGFRVEGRAGRAADVHIQEAAAGRPPMTIVLWETPSVLDPHALAWAAKRAGEIGAISPPLARLRSDTSGTATVRDEEIYRMLSRLNRWALIPHLNMAGFGDLDRWTPDALHDALAPLDADGLLVRLDGRENWSLQDLMPWVRRAASLLEAQGRRLYLGLPDLITSRLSSVPPMAMIPGVDMVVGPDAETLVRAGAAVERRIPASEMDTDIRQYYELVAERVQPDRSRHEDVRAMRDEAEAHYGAGDYEEAVTLWFDWHEIDPDHAFPLRRIGDALHRLGYRDEAVDFYQQSLERDPGNIDLAVQVIQLLDAEGEQEESRRLLETYGLLFPEEPAILLAQAEWLFRRGRLAESSERVRQVLAVEPNHMQAALLMAHLARTSEDRREAILRLQRLARDESAQLRVLQTVRDADLLTLPEAEPLIEMVRGLNERELAEEVSRLVRMMLPRHAAVREDFAGGEMGTEWRADGASVEVRPNRLLVRADPGREEVLLRLSGSDRWRNAFVEVEVDDVEGDFWIMLRRSRHNLIRYGFDETLGQMLLQIWEREGEQLVLKDYRVESWTRPSGAVRLRLEVRGEGIVPLQQGGVWSAPPLPLPQGLTPGWVAVAVHSAEPGRAEMVLRSMSAGPLFPSLARMSDVSGDQLEAQAARLRGMLGGISALSPSWFSVGPDGTWSSQAGEADAFYRMFARYHGLSLLPEVRVAPGARPGAGTLADAARLHNVRGFLLVLEHAPSAAWVRDLNVELAETGLDVLLAYPQGDTGAWRLMGLGNARLLFPGAPEGQTVEDIPVQQIESVSMARENGPVWIRF